MATNIKRLGSNRVQQYTQNGKSSSGLWFPLPGPTNIGEADLDGGRPPVGLGRPYAPDPAPKVWNIDLGPIDPPTPGSYAGLILPRHTSEESAWYLINFFGKVSPNLDHIELINQSGFNIDLDVNGTPNIWQTLLIWDGVEWNALMDKSVS